MGRHSAGVAPIVIHHCAGGREYYWTPLGTEDAVKARLIELGVTLTDWQTDYLNAVLDRYNIEPAHIMAHRPGEGIIR